jgi:hypothetical protein
LALLGFITDRASLRDVKEGMLRSHTRNIYKGDNDAVYVEDIPEIKELAERIEQKRIERGATSGFERLYHRVASEYFGGMHRVFEQLYHVMRPEELFSDTNQNSRVAQPRCTAVGFR